MHWTSAAVDSVTLERDSLGRVHKTHSFRSHSQSASCYRIFGRVSSSLGRSRIPVLAAVDTRSRVGSSPARAHVPVPSLVDSRRRMEQSSQLELLALSPIVLLRPASPAVCQIVGRTWQCWIKNQMLRGSSGCRRGPIQRMPSRALDWGQRLNAWSSSSKRQCGSASAQRPSNSHCLAAAVGGSSETTQFRDSVGAGIWRSWSARSCVVFPLPPASQRDVRHQPPPFSQQRLGVLFSECSRGNVTAL